MIILYEKSATTFDDNGICILNPSSCVVTEVAGGQFELELEHPLDDNHKYMMLTEERLIKAPVPKTVIPETVLPELKAWRVITVTSLYSKTPSSTYKNKNWKTIQKVKQNPLNYAWYPHRYYNYGAVVLYGNTVYQASQSSIGRTPSSSPFVWSALGTLDDAAPTYDVGTIIESLAVDTLIYKIADKGSYIQARTTSGHVGFVPVDDCTETTERQQETIPETTITEQVFRIYETACDEETNTYTVRAKHISYDFMGNSLYDCKVTEASPLEAIAAIQGSLAMDDDRRIACNITGEKVSQDWSFKNPVSALLDLDSGLVGKLDARLVRNNHDFFILDSSSPRAGITITYGVNMLGVNWTRSIENVVTRVIPRSGSSDKGYIYISNGGRISGTSVQNQGKDYVESSIADSYEVPRISVLNCSYAEGQEYEASDGTKKKYTKEEVLDKMLIDAKEKFTKDKIDGVDITLEVEFLLLGDTEEYKQYRDLQWVSLYDIVKVRTGKSGIDAEAQVTEYEYDCLRKRYNSIKLGTVNSFTKRIAGYRFINGSITYDKLSPDLIDRIVTANASSTTDSGSAGDTSSGGGEDVVVSVVDNLTSTSATDALSANQGRILNGHFPLLGTTQDPVADLDSIPLNSIGNVILSATVSPSGILRQHSFWKAGYSATRYVIFAVDQYAKQVYYQVNYDGTLLGWQKIPDGVENSLTSTSTTNALSANQGRVLNNKIEKGLYVNTGSQVAAGSYQDFSITFAHTFENAPVVFAQPSLTSSATSNENGKISYVMISSTTTGAVIRAFNNANIARGCSFNWVAIEGR